MSTIGDQDPIDRVTRQCQIIVVALIMGVAVMLGVAMVVDLRPNAVGPPGAGANPARVQGELAADRPDVGTILTWVAVAFAAVTLPLSFVLPKLVSQQNRWAIAAGKWPPTSQRGFPAKSTSPDSTETDAGKLAMVYQTQLIIGAALNEGVAFFAAIAYLIGKNPIALLLGLLLLGGLVARFPTKSRVEQWMDQQQEQLILDKQAAI